MTTLPSKDQEITGGRKPALGNIANKVVAARFQRFSRRQRSSEWLIGDARETVGLPRDVRDDDTQTWVRPLRPARCRWRAASAVGVHHDEDHEYAHYSGLERCASIWSCPVCASVIRAERAREIGLAAESAHELGYGMTFATMTQRHKRSDRLPFTIDVMLAGWRKLQTHTAWRNLAKHYGIIGSIRSTEITFGGNGWHPHNHLLFVHDRLLNVHEVEAFQGAFGALWIKLCKKIGAGIPTQEHGVKIVKVDKGGKVIAEYISKLQEDGEYIERETSIGLEIARGDLKTGRRESIVPFQLLDAAGDGSETARALWIEYVHATRGRRAFSWSRGLRDLLLTEEEELTDEEVIEKAEQAEIVILLDGDFYDTYLRDDPAALSGALELAELGLESFIVEEFSSPDHDQKSRVRFKNPHDYAEV